MPIILMGCDECTIRNQAREIEALRAEANQMRIALVVQMGNLMDLCDRYARHMHKRGDAEDRDYIQGGIDHASKVLVQFNYNGPWQAKGQENKNEY